MHLVLFGAPASGKGTQADFLKNTFKLAHIATGDLLRGEVEKGSKLGLEAKGYMTKGALVPDETIINMVLERLKADDAKAGCLFDGFPRTLEQAKGLDGALAAAGKKIDGVVYIKVEEAELVSRISGRWTCRQCQATYNITSSPPHKKGICDKCGGELYQRTDDNENAFRERLKNYLAQTMPLLDYYKKQNKLVEVDGQGKIADIAERITKALKQKGLAK